ncbi:MAG: hypothetical protein PHF58_13160 [Methylotenera sp.]|nr:hypothetical protein [Methylotenera sp.]
MLSNVFFVISLITMTAYWFMLLIGINPWVEVSFLSSHSDNGLLLFAKISIIFISGAWIIDFFISNVSESKINNEKIISLDSVGERSIQFLGIVFLATILLAPLNYGVDLFLRNSYQLGDSPGAIAELIGTVFEFFLGFGPCVYRFFRVNNNLGKSLSRAIILLSVIVLYGVSTKLAGVAVVLYALSGFIQSKGFVKYIIVGLIGLLIVAVTLHQRALGIYGIFSITDTISSLLDDPSGVIGFIIQVVASSVFITSETVGRSYGSIDFLFTEINPLPGALTDWYEIYPRLRISEAVPFNSLGTLYSISPVLVFIFGMTASLAIWALRDLVSIFLPIGGGVIVMLFSVFLSATITQYNLRGSMRWIYYVFIAWFLIKSVHVFFGKRRL